ncbi:DUF3575 domain-containing protein [Alistipes sp. OttesenSCG-928-B03]|nr:DUF3575 domain-containing protein [Alistipes sp. OttesenSCG-928-B03]
MKKTLVTAISLLGALVLGTGRASAQPPLSVKTNAAYWATVTPNLALEIGLSRRLTLELGGGYNPSANNDRSIEHFIVQPELRWWFNQAFAGTFVGVHIHGGKFDLYGFGPLTMIKENRLDGWLAGAGISIGRHWLLGSRWGVEAEIGAGFATMRYDKYPLPVGEAVMGERYKNNYIGPTRINLSLVYYIW